MKGFRSYFFILLILSACSVEKTEKPAITLDIPIENHQTISPAKKEASGQASKESNIADNIDNQIEDLRKEIKNAEIIRVGDEIKIVFNSQILFQVDSDQLESGAEKSLADLANVLSKYNGTVVEVTGHTDNTGDEEYNLNLSKRRAAAVARYTASQGVNPTRFRINGFGETIPIASNKIEEGRQLNRRVEISIRGSEFLNPRMAETYREMKDSACFCTDQYKHYVCKRLCDSWMKLPASALSFNNDYFKQPASLDELFVATKEENGNKLYHVGGGDHIVRQNIGKTLEENNAIIMVGKVMERGTREPTRAKIKVRLMDTGEEVAEVDADSLTGGYSILLERGRQYSISIEENGYLIEKKNISIPEMQGFTVIREDMHLTELKAGQKMDLKNVFFEQSKPTLLESSYEQLNEVVQLMVNNPSLEIELQGHTDGVGDPELNFKLSEDRVKTIEKYLVAQGISDNRISTKAYGGTMPIASNDSEETRKLNRRVEFVIIRF